MQIGLQGGGVLDAPQWADASIGLYNRKASIIPTKQAKNKR